MSEIREKDVAAEIIGAMLAQNIVPSVFEIRPAEDEGWIIEGTVIGHMFDGLRHKFYGTASPDGTSFTVTSGAFGKLTEKELDLWADLSGAGVETTEEET